MMIESLTKEILNKFEYDGIEPMAKGWKQRAEIYMSLGESWFVKEKDQYIMLGGFFEISEGVVQAWMLFNRESRHYAKSILKAIRAKVDGAFDKGYHRIQTFAYKTDLSSRGYIELMGFSYESKLEQFGPNREDMVVYKIVRG